MKKLLVPLALIIAGAAGAAAAREPGDRFKALDPDGDGRIAVADLDERHKERMAKVDGNADGYITKEEMQAAHDARRAEHRAKAFPDGNGDGSVDIGEFRNGADARFRALDADGDGRLTEDEAKAGRGERKRGR
jgi:hypothetical protein